MASEASRHAQSKDPCLTSGRGAGRDPSTPRARSRSLRMTTQPRT